jgi:UDP-N-acetyl-D-mannosaminuronate dehydrogenase
MQRHKHVLEDLEVLHKQERLKSEQKMKKIILEFRAVGGEMKDLSHAMEKLVIPVVTAESGVEAFASSSKLEIDALNICACQKDVGSL